MNDTASSMPSPQPSPGVPGEGVKRRLLRVFVQLALIVAFVIVTLVMWLPAIVSKVPATTQVR